METTLSQNKPEPTAAALLAERNKFIKIREGITLVGLSVCAAYLHGVLTNDSNFSILGGVGLLAAAIGTTIMDSKAAVAERKRLRVLYEGRESIINR